VVVGFGIVDVIGSIVVGYFVIVGFFVVLFLLYCLDSCDILFVLEDCVFFDFGCFVWLFWILLWEYFDFVWVWIIWFLMNFGNVLVIFYFFYYF